MLYPTSMTMIRARVLVQPYKYPRWVRELVLQLNDEDRVIRRFYRYMSWEEFAHVNKMNETIYEQVQVALAGGKEVFLEGIRLKEIEILDDEIFG